ncbi:MAG: hypothetical protein LBG98_01625 [Puniceicoccales bacterium]|nr:hypothetical protein [Puniceicoccales bacterium]
MKAPALHFSFAAARVAGRSPKGSKAANIGGLLHEFLNRRISEKAIGPSRKNIRGVMVREE